MYPNDNQKIFTYTTPKTHLRVRYMKIRNLICSLRYPTTSDPIQIYKTVANAYMSGLKIPRICSEQMKGTDQIITNYLLHNYQTPILTAKVSCCEYPVIGNVPYIWRDILSPMMKVVTSCLTGKLVFNNVDINL